MRLMRPQRDVHLFGRVLFHHRPRGRLPDAALVDAHDITPGRDADLEVPGFAGDDAAELVVRVRVPRGKERDARADDRLLRAGGDKADDRAGRRGMRLPVMRVRGRCDADAGEKDHDCCDQSSSCHDVHPFAFGCT